MSHSQRLDLQGIVLRCPALAETCLRLFESLGTTDVVHALQVDSFSCSAG